MDHGQPEPRLLPANHSRCAVEDGHRRRQAARSAGLRSLRRHHADSQTVVVEFVGETIDICRSPSSTPRSEVTCSSSAAALAVLLPCRPAAATPAQELDDAREQS
jgi:hypothetical protein